MAPQSVKSMDSAFAKARVDRRYIAYRGVSSAAEEQLKRLKPGDVVASPVYLSVTTSLQQANRFGTNLMRIVLDKGARAISMSVVSGIPGDVLLDRNQRLVFDGVGDAGEYKFHVGGSGNA